MKTNEITIHQTQQKDKPAIMRMLKDTKFFRDGEIVIAEEVLDDSLICGKDGEYRSYSAVENNETIGWVCFGPTACTIGTFDVFWIVVNPKSQAKGLGTKLMDFATDLIKKDNGRLIVVETSGMAKYLATQKFYEKLGYKKEAVLKDFYTKGDDKIIYLKKC
ncbi:MAG: GNAT family N-acetyltransferase [Phycisphaerae bacterium]|jgi:ribosomal protein S18 acetylase RimI-like enzyme